MLNFIALVAGFIVAISLPLLSSAALIDRGNGLIYDSSTNLTWMQDANFAKTSGFKGVNNTDQFGRVYPSVDQNGRMNWNEAMRLADETSFAGFDDWRLPRQGTGPAHYEDRHSELAVLFYTSLQNRGAMEDGVWQKGPYGLINKGPFVVDTTSVFWTSDTYGYHYAWLFDVSAGFAAMTERHDISTHFGAWLVRDGDVITAVPEPSTQALLLLGIAIAALQRKRAARLSSHA